MQKRETANMRITTRFTRSELEVVAFAADAQNLPISTFLKRVALIKSGATYKTKVRAVTKRNKVDAHIIGALGKIGNNVNHIARLVNSNQSLSGDEVRSLILEMRALRSSLVN